MSRYDGSFQMSCLVSHSRGLEIFLSLVQLPGSNNLPNPKAQTIPYHQNQPLIHPTLPILIPSQPTSTLPPPHTASTIPTRTLLPTLHIPNLRLPAQTHPTTIRAHSTLAAPSPQSQHITDADLFASGHLLLQLASLGGLEATVCDIGGLFALLGTQAVRPEGGAGGGVAVEVDDEDEEG
jgi:hypothetical protein